MKTDVEASIRAIADFITDQDFSAPFFGPNDAVRSAYQKYLAVLLMRHGSHKTALFAGAREFLDETASDLSYALYLSALGFYKPARLSLRGAIENSLRFALKQKGLDIAGISISQLFEQTKEYADYAPVCSAISLLKDRYSRLCRTSHTIDIKFMAQRIPFTDLVEANKSKFESNMSDFAKVAGAICNLFYVVAPEAITKMSPDQQDMVRSQITRIVKKAILNA